MSGTLRLGGRGNRFLSVFGFFLIFFTIVVGVFDAVCTYNIYRQTRAESFPTTSGQITASEVESHSDSDGTTYGAAITFTYTVNNNLYSSDTWRFGAWSSSDDDHAREVVGRYPVGQEVTVYYDPDDPESAVLEVGVQPMDMFLLLFLTPFNLIMLWLWSMGIGSLRRKVSKPPAGGVSIVRRGMCTYIRLPRLSPLTAAGISALAVSFVSIFVVAFGTGMNPPMWVLNVVWGVVAGVALAVYFWRTYVVGSGVKDLVIDDERHVLSLPQSFGRKEDILVPLASVIKTDVRTRVHRSSKGGTSYTYVPRIHWRDQQGQEHEEQLIEWHDSARAYALTQWLAERIRVSHATQGDEAAIHHEGETLGDEILDMLDEEKE